MVIFQAQAGMAALHRLHRRDDAAADAANEALDLYRAGGFRRFRNRIDPAADLLAAAAVSYAVLAVIAAERDEPERAATLLGHADGLHNDAAVWTLALLQPDVAQARDAVITALGDDAFRAAYERGKHAVEETRPS